MSGLGQLSPGTMFAGDYRVERPLREGGMGAVYVVEQISTGKRRALKLMQPELIQNAATAPVGSCKDGASPFGLMDMAGNVWEWTADWYGPYSSSPQVNPHGPEKGTQRVQRGGGWMDNDASLVRAARRAYADVTLSDKDLGFRCARKPME